MAYSELKAISGVELNYTNYIYFYDAYLRRSMQSHTNAGRMDSCVC